MNSLIAVAAIAITAVSVAAGVKVGRSITFDNLAVLRPWRERVGWYGYSIVMSLMWWLIVQMIIDVAEQFVTFVVITFIVMMLVYGEGYAFYVRRMLQRLREEVRDSTDQ